MTDSALPLAVIGGSSCSEHQRQLALETGREIAAARATLLCGGRGGIMAAAAEGARSAGGRTVGILPGCNGRDSPPNPHIELAIYSGMGQARNQILVLSAAAVIAVGGGWGTLSEIAMARKYAVPVVQLESWVLSLPPGVDDGGIFQAETPRQAVELALRAAAERGTR